jgi:hypothetical protein
MPMHPLIEVSTGGGKNMRETCARVLAAALLTGAIATVVGMSALFGTTGEASRPISAPPSSLQRSVRLTAHLAPRARPSAARLVTAHTNYVPSRRRTTTVLAATRTRRVSPRAPRQLTSVRKPQPAPASAPTPAPPAVPAAPADPAPPVTEQSDDQSEGHGHGHGHGHAYGHDKQDE